MCGGAPVDVAYVLFVATAGGGEGWTQDVEGKEGETKGRAEVERRGKR